MKLYCIEIIIYLMSKMDGIGYNAVYIAEPSFYKKNKHTWIKYVKIFTVVISE